jgi:4-alpha-glucanotransferase
MMDLHQRRAGLVLHLTSLPGPHGHGDLGEQARRFVDWLAAAGQTVWQMLPVNPVGPGHSPYQSPSAFAGNTGLVALEPLAEAGWLISDELAGPEFDRRRVDFAQAILWRSQRLRRAASGFAHHADRDARDAFAAWRHAESSWLDEWTLFRALKAHHQGRPWWDWTSDLARRDADSLRAARAALVDEIDAEAFAQWCFDTQLGGLREFARSRGVHVMGDLPIFVAHDSADVWARPDLYWLDDSLQPSVVAGVPPDGFSPDGQRWGNPLYRWERMADEGFAWWIARVRRALAHADVFRIDHFRGFAGYWEVPASCPTAAEGRWAPGPGRDLFAAIEAELGRLPIVAEDLGHMTPEVHALRDEFGFPGMRILQEAFSRDAAHDFLPHHFVRHGLAYTSTHDSNTALGWWREAPASQKAFAAEYLGLRADSNGHDVPWALIRGVCTSIADMALYPLQDVLALDGSQRMNLPGTAEGNWAWRFEWPMIGDAVAPALARLAAATGRAPFGLLVSAGLSLPQEI